MLKRSSIRRIMLATFALIITILAINLFPVKDVKIKTKTYYKEASTSSIYLVDKNHYVARTNIYVDNSDKLKLAKELVDALINGTNKNKYLPDGFISLIPENTKVLNITIDGDTISLYFDENILNVKKNDEEKMVESIVYTLTEIDGINNVKIFINDKELTTLPQSGRTLPFPLNRSIGINRKSKITSIKNSKEVTTYFLANNNDESYFIPVTFTTDDEGEKVEIIIKELKSSENIDSSLKTYLSASTLLKNYELKENEVNLEFNNNILNQFNKIDEEVKYGIKLSIMDTYNVKSVNFNVK